MRRNLSTEPCMASLAAVPSALTLPLLELLREPASALAPQGLAASRDLCEKEIGTKPQMTIVSSSDSVSVVALGRQYAFAVLHLVVYSLNARSLVGLESMPLSLGDRRNFRLPTEPLENQRSGPPRRPTQALLLSVLAVWNPARSMRAMIEKVHFPCRGLHRRRLPLDLRLPYWKHLQS